MHAGLFNKKSLNLIRELTIAEFKLRDQGSVFGFAWTLLHPLLVFLVLYLVFSKWTGKFVGDFKGYLLIGIIQWNFFAGSTSYALDSVLRRRELVKNIRFPTEILVASSVFTGLISHILEIAVLLAFLFFTGTSLTLTVLWLPLAVVIELILVLAVSFMLSGLFVFFRDTQRIWQILIMIGFFVTPVFYSLSMISERAQKVLLFNPLAHIINFTRSILLSDTCSHNWYLAATFIFSSFLLAVSYCVFKKLSRRFVEVI